MIIHIVKLVGLLIMVAVLAFSWTLYVNASRFEREIEAESDDSGEE